MIRETQVPLSMTRKLVIFSVFRDIIIDSYTSSQASVAEVTLIFIFLACTVTQYRHNEKVIRKPFSGKSQEIVILYENDKENTSPSLNFVRFPKTQIFVEIFCINFRAQYGAAMLV